VSRVGVFGWGVVAPKSPDIETFARNLEQATSWLEPFDGFGPDSFLVGKPAFDFAAYKAWIDERFPPNRFPQLVEKMDSTSLFAIGAFVQALGQNPGLEAVLRELGTAAHVYVGTGLGALPTIAHETLSLARAQRRWNRFWAAPERNAALADYLALPAEDRALHPDVPPEPASVEELLRDEAEETWWAYWAARSDGLAAYLAEVREIEALRVEGEVEAGKLSLIKEKQRRHGRLQKRWGAPDPPWRAVSPNLVWNIHNTPAAQISMLGHITGPAFAPVAACSTFGVCLKLGMDAIRRGEAKVAVIGASDPPPHPLTVGAFYAARVIAADGAVSKPLTELRGTHVAGGAAIWIVGDLEYLESRGFRPLGMEPVAVGVTADAHHIITPSKAGPAAAVKQAMAASGMAPAEVATWDLHATATPGDFLEVETLREIVPESVVVTARKGTFGHGMGACGGWELTAQYLGVERGRLFPTAVAPGELNAEIARVHDRFVFDRPLPCHGAAGKLSMGIGGINACVLSRPLPPREGA
jgi:3-oxoacyl-[acyl-carrier-protein] synthase II